MVNASKVSVRTIWAATCIGAIAVIGGCASTISSASTPVNLQVEDDMWSYQELLTQECMHDSGFEYSARIAPPATGQHIAQSPYALTLQRAQSDGFGYVQSIVSEVVGMSKNDVNVKYRENLSETQQLRFDHALEGNPMSDSPGCRADAQERASDKFSDQVVTMVGSSEALMQVVEDARYVKFESAWAQCMTSAGYATSGFEEFHRTWVVKASAIAPSSDVDPSSRTLDPTISARTVDPRAAEAALNAEIAAAVANVKCLQPLESDFDALIDDVLG